MRVTIKTIDALIAHLGGRKLKTKERGPINGRKLLYRFEFNGFTAYVTDYSRKFDGYLLRFYGEQKKLAEEDYELGIKKLEEIDSAVKCYDKAALLKCNLDFGYYAEGVLTQTRIDRSLKAILHQGISAIKLEGMISEIKERKIEKILVLDNRLFFEARFPLQLYFDKFKIVIPQDSLNYISECGAQLQSGIQPDDRTNPENTLNQILDKISAVASLYVRHP